MFCLGEYLRLKRKSLNLSLDAVYKVTGITDSRLHRIENGENEYPSAPILKLLANTYNIDIIELYLLVGYLNKDDISSYLHDFSGVELLTNKEKKHIQNQIDFLIEQKSQEEV